jgi:hypothetical protein
LAALWTYCFIKLTYMAGLLLRPLRLHFL